MTSYNGSWTALFVVTTVLALLAVAILWGYRDYGQYNERRLRQRNYRALARVENELRARVKGDQIRGAEPDLARILRDLLNERRDEFEHLLVVKPSGQVWWQPTGAVTLASLDGHLEAQEHADALAAGTSGRQSSAVREHALSAAHAERIQVFGETYVMFAAPLGKTDFPPLTGMVLVGLARDQRLSGEAWEIPTLPFVGGLLGVILVVLSWPVLKLFLMGARERLKGLDVRVLFLSAVLASGVVTFMVGSFGARFQLRRQFDAALIELTASVVEDVESRLEEARLQMNVLRSLQSPEPRKLESVGSSVHSVAVVRRDGAVVRRWERSDPRRQSSFSWTPPPVALRLADRGYFKDVTARVPRLWPGPAGSGGDRFALQLVLNRLRGTESLIAARSASDVGLPDGVLLTSSDLPDGRPVLPRGFGFAVVDDRGRGQFHSQRFGTLDENFFEEAEMSPALIAAVAARNRVALWANYGGKDRRMFVRPIDGLPWLVVGFYDASVLDVVLAQTLTAWVSLFVLYALVLALLLLAIEVVSPGFRATWLWPDRSFEATATYSSITSCLLWTFVAGYAALQNDTGPSTFAAILGLALCVVPATYLVTRWVRRDDRTLAAHRGTDGDARRSLWCIASLAAGSGLVGLWLVAQAFASMLVAIGPVLLLVLAVGAMWWSAVRLPGHPWIRHGASAAVVAFLAVILLLATGHRWGTITLLLIPAILCSGVAAANPTDEKRRAAGAPGRSARTETGLRTSHAAVLASLLLVLGVLPAAIFFRDADHQVTVELRRLGQLDFARQLEERARSSDESGGGLSFPLSWISISRGSLPRHLRRSADTMSSLAQDHALATGRLMEAEIRGMRISSSADGRYHWFGDGGFAVNHPYVTLTDLVWPKQPEEPAGASKVIVGSWLVLLLLVGAAGYAVVSLTSKRLFLLEADENDGAGRAGPRLASGALRVWVFEKGPETLRELLQDRGERGSVLDLRPGIAPGSIDRWMATQPIAERIVEIRHMEAALRDVEKQEELLRALEALSHRPALRMVLVTAVHPLAYLADRIGELQEHGSDPDDPLGAVRGERRATLERLRCGWVGVLREFTPLQLQALRQPDRDVERDPSIAKGRTSAEDRFVSDELKAHGFAFRECEWPIAVRTLQAILSAYALPRAGPTDHDTDVAAEPTHQFHWTYSSEEERLVLRQLAEERFLSPAAVEVVRGLMERGLIRRAPAFEFVTESFRRFVLRVERARTIDAWERAAGWTTWDKVKYPLFGALFLVFALLLYSEPAILDSTKSVVPVLAATLPLLLRFLGSSIGEVRNAMRDG